MGLKNYKFGVFWMGSGFFHPLKYIGKPLAIACKFSVVQKLMFH